MSMLRSLALTFSRLPRLAQIGGGVAALVVVGAGVSSLAGRSGDEVAIRAVLAAHQAIDTRSCLTFRFAPGLNFESWAGRQFWMASTPWTAPDRHPFIFYAGPADDTAPEIVADLAHRGVLERHLVPVSFLSGGVASAAIYTTRRNDPDFSYELVQPNFMQRGSPLGTLAWPMSAVAASRYTAGVEPGAAYNAGTTGVLLGDGPRGMEPTPFVQALMAAGAVRRVPVTWVVHTTHPGTPTAAQLGLHDLDDSSEPKPSEPPPANVEATTRFEGDLFLGSGPEIVGHFEIPPDERGHIGAVSIPPLLGTTSPPSGLTSASRYCYALAPQRVLEFGPLQTVETGHQRITVVVLMTPEQVPGWASDPRVLEVFAPQFIRPQQVFLATYDNFGDGWKKFGLTFAKDLAETGHYVGE